MKIRFLVLLPLTAAIALAVAATAAAGVEIFHIQYNPPGRDTGTNRHVNLEYVYIANTGARAVQLRGWRLRDRQGNVYRFPRYRLGRSKYVAVRTGKGRNSRAAGFLYWGRRSYVWNNAGDTATLKNARGRTVDRCGYRGTSAGSKTCYTEPPGNL